MTSKALAWVAVSAMIAVLAIRSVSAVTTDSGVPMGIPPRTVADYLHAVIMAHRTFYTIHIVNRLQQEEILDATEDWRVRKTLPLPIQFLKESLELAEVTDTKLHYHLISQWPINKANAPATEFERRGLEEVQMHPDRPYTAILDSGREQLFGAVYADLAVTQACIGCHNYHPNSPKSDFKMDDVMGGLVIIFPLNQH
jgi:Protein of unknown function (DUF3365)